MVEKLLDADRPFLAESINSFLTRINATKAFAGKAWRMPSFLSNVDISMLCTMDLAHRGKCSEI